MLTVGYQRQRALILALLASLLLWNLPFGGLVLYPFKLLATWLHEMSHGAVMLLSGAGFDHLEIFSDTSGLAQAKHAIGVGGRAAIHCAGYMGTALFGAFLLVLGQTRPGARSIPPPSTPTTVTNWPVRAGKLGAVRSTPLKSISS